MQTQLKNQFYESKLTNYFTAIIFRFLNFATPVIRDLFLDYLVNNIIWGHFEMEDQEFQMFGCSTFYIPMGTELILFASTNLERVPLIDNKGTVSFFRKLAINILFSNSWVKSTYTQWNYTTFIIVVSFIIKEQSLLKKILRLLWIR